MLRQVLLHNTALMSPRLLFAFALSFAVHGALLFPEFLKRPSASALPPALQVKLRLPPGPTELPTDLLLKNTLTTADIGPETIPPRSNTPAAKRAATIRQRKTDLESAQEKLSQHVYFPPEAKALGLEGEVHLILRFSADGTIEDISMAASSGHAILDNAAINAVKAAYAAGQLTDIRSRELILPVIFRLQE